MRRFVISLRDKVDIGIPTESFRAVTDGPYGKFRWWCAMLRPVVSGEIGCALSHRTIWRKLVESCESDENCVAVFEDDVRMGSGIERALELAASKCNEDPLSVVLLGNHTDMSKRGVAIRETDAYRLESAQWDICSEAYVIGREAARNLVWAQRTICCPADSWGRWVRKGLIHLYHIDPPVCGQRDHVSSIGRRFVAPISGLGRLWWKVRRCIGCVLDGILDGGRWGW